MNILIELNSTDTCAQIYCVKYHVKQFNNKCAILKKMCCVNWRFRSFVQYILLDFSLTVKAATLIFISGCGSAISSAKEGKSGLIFNLVKC